VESLAAGQKRFREGEPVTVEGRPATLIYVHQGAAVVRYADDSTNRVVPLRKLRRRTD
jgi:hypothetical protein